MKYADYMVMSPDDRMFFYRNLDNKADREKHLFFRAQAELMLGRAWRRQKHRIVGALREYDARYGIIEDDLNELAAESIVPPPRVRRRCPELHDN